LIGMDTVTLPPDLERFATDAVASGRYRTLSEVVEAGLSLLQRTEAARRALLMSVLQAQHEADRLGSLSTEDLTARVDARLAQRPQPPE
jgi:putative addiction module CopG family antidote